MSRCLPVPVTPLAGAADLAMGDLHTLALVGPVPTYTLTVQASPPWAGTVQPAVPVTGCRYGTPMPLMATPLPGWDFLGWGGSGGSACDPAAAETVCFVTADCTMTALFENTLEIGVSADADWVYENALRTAYRHKAVLTVEILGGEVPGESYDIVELLEDGGAPMNFALWDDMVPKPMAAATETLTVHGRQFSPSPAGRGSHTISVTVRGQLYYQEDSASLTLTLRQLGDIDGNGAADLTDAAWLNDRINTVASPFSLRAYDLDGNGGADLTDRALLNDVVNSVPID
jgi:hypothetical protein